MKHLISVPQNVVPQFHQISGLPEKDWFVDSDPDGKRIGSGGGTSWLLSECWKNEGSSDFSDWLKQEKRIIVHAGGKSRRLPAYAPIGKSLLPMPVFRWSRGQDLNQRLIHLQTPLFEKIIRNAPPELNTLVASGDTLIFKGKKLPEIPRADVVCFGLWLEPDKASNHGVFFANRENPEQLQFMLQKPSIETIQELVQTHYFLMDIGIWLMSPTAVDLLMKNSGWKGKAYENIIPNDYDLYSTFGTALGENPKHKDKEISNLKVALVNLEDGEFYHLGNTSELVSSTLAIQNRVSNQREIWHKNIKPHPSIFVLNSRITNRFTPLHKNIWIENSSIPDSWYLNRDHCLTGIPQNNWEIKLEKGVCLDFVPVQNNKFAIRFYGFYDKFSGKVNDTTTLFFDEPVISWFEKRALKLPAEGDYSDIQNFALFPVLEKTQLTAGFINWLCAKEPKISVEHATTWKQAERLSANDLGERADLTRLENQRENLHRENVKFLSHNYKRSVFYQLDLKRLANEVVAKKLEIAEEIHTENEWTSIHHNMFRAAIQLQKGTGTDTFEKKAFEELQQNVLNKFRKNTVLPKINLLADQIAWGRSPVRLDLAGGWTDTPPYCMLYGGKVLNVAVELNGQPPLQCFIKATPQKHIVLRSIDLGAQEVINSYDDLKNLSDIQSAFSIPKAALVLSGFNPDFCSRKYPSLEKQLDELGGGLEISILAAVPKGSGLGTSSILAATVLGTLSEVCCLNWDKMETGKRVLALEQILTTGGGWQDQFGGLFEGIKLLETQTGNEQQPLIKWLPDNLFSDPVFQKRMLLYYTGITRVAKSILADIVRGMFLNSFAHLHILEDLKQHAEDTYECIIKKDYRRLGEKIQKSWELNQSLDSGTNTPEIQQIIEKIEPHIIGQKLLGAGGGGFMLILAKDEQAANQIRTMLSENPINPRARLIDFAVSKTGFQVRKS